jgi:hypothetical protein
LIKTFICRAMSSLATLEIVISPAFDRRGERLAGKFDARLGRGEWLVRGAATPLYSSAHLLLARGLAKPEDIVTMKHAGSSHELLRSTIGKAAKLASQAHAGASSEGGGYPGGGRGSTR